MEDVINHPSHYADQGVDGLEPIDLLENYAGNIFNMLKYVIRAGHKKGNPTELDLGKALYYCSRAIGNCDYYGRFSFFPNCIHNHGLTKEQKKLMAHLEENNLFLQGLFDSEGRITVVRLCHLERQLQIKLEEIKNGTQD